MREWSEQLNTRPLHSSWTGTDIHMLGAMVFGEEVSKVDSAWGPIDVELILFDVIAEPVESHVNGFVLVLTQIV